MAEIEIKPMSRERYTQVCRGALTYEDYLKTYCLNCQYRSDCQCKEKVQRLPRYAGGLGLCKNLENAEVQNL
ncbi:MAG: hypothetical protein NC253_03065 [Ruminococcus sp.]|nr:hypothetical protein [Ruminococcus sp.]MCM1380376.1 hypothetical protein [Muribaculaceae bacterium]MCM1478314.1 hypothetical protein [Muribaculaceae bacterium]